MLKKRFRILIVRIRGICYSRQDKRDLLTELLRLVSGAGKCGAKEFCWLKAVTDCRPVFA